jgi:predicted RNA-binding protein associated with RNAse of E/G family
VTIPSVEIHYRRLPDRVQVFRQAILEERPEVTVTFLESAALKRDVTAEKEVILEPGSPVVWFTYPGRWYDIGRFHLADGTFTGFYANIITPPRMDGARWETTDLCLDVWLGADGAVQILDEAEFQLAADSGWIDTATQATAREHAETLAHAARQGAWPPKHVLDWTLERARKRVEELRR